MRSSRPAVVPDNVSAIRATLPDVAARLDAMSDGELAHLAGSDATASAWGASGRMTVDEVEVFLKRIPLTAEEAAEPYATRNLFDLPVYYSYGVGSAGFGVWRELAAHQATTGLVGFPQLLHHRVMERSMPAGELWVSDADYVAYWNGSAAIGRFIEARRVARQEVWIVLEFVPHPLFLWLIQNQEHVDDVLSQLFEAIGALRDRGIVHFDAHLGNVVTDGVQCRLGDFGLAMAADFELAAEERSFLGAHQHYDYGVVLSFFAQTLAFALGEDLDADRVGQWIDEIDGLPVNYHPALVAALRRYREPIVYIAEFFTRVRQPDKHSVYDDAAFARLLRSAGAPGI